MRRYFVRNLLFTGSILLILGASLVYFVGVYAKANSGDTPVPLSGHTVPLIQKAQLVHAADNSLPLRLSVGMQVRNRSQLQSLVHAFYDPRSPSYHHFFTSQQFAQSFGPTAGQVQAVTAFLQQQGLQVTHVASNNLLVDATATVAQAEHAFSTQINTYQLGTRSFYANATPPSVPASISPLIAGINGLDDSMQFLPYYQGLASAARTVHQPARMHHAGVAASQGYGPSDLAAAYDLQPLQSAGVLGDNQTIALFELDGYLSSDINQYFQTYNLGTPSISNVPVDGFNGSAGFQAVEDELDIEVASAIAPHANLLVYEGPNSIQGINDTFNQIVLDNRAQVATTSWGNCENNLVAAELNTLDTMFLQAAGEGISFFAASGDSGAYDCRDTNLFVDSPASDPYITGVGGTSLTLTDGAYGSETTWANSSDTSHGPEGSGGGGGLSMLFTQPSWQSGTGVQNPYSNGKREVPDVSAEADPTIGYAVYCTVTNAGCPSTGWITIGGTSGATPFWAASTALINQYMFTQGATPPAGNLNATLYGLLNSQPLYPAFHDITVGNNLHYPATTGYDLASGLGSPDVYNLARDLAPPAGTILAKDTFQRANQALWGTATDSQTWGGDANTLSAFSIASNLGVIASNSTSMSAVLGPTATDAEVLFTGKMSAFNGGNLGAALRWTDGNDWYKAYIDGTNLIVQKKVAVAGIGITTVLSTVAFAATANKLYDLRFRVVGTTLYAKVWLASKKEPTTWMITTTDTTFQSGYCGLRMLVPSGVTARFSLVQVTAQ